MNDFLLLLTTGNRCSPYSDIWQV